MKHKTSIKFLKKKYLESYEVFENICDLNVSCISRNSTCIECVLNTEQSREEFNRITENKTKLITPEEVQESINILVILG
jgi:hypothetical protein